MTTLRIIDDAIELDGVTVGTLIPGLRLSIRDQLVEVFALAGEGEETIIELEARVARLEASAR